MAANAPSLRASGRVRRRKLVNRSMEGVAWLASLLAVVVLGVVTISVLIKGLGALNLDLLTQTQATFGEPGGGIAHAIVGTVVVVGLGALIALPVGVLIAVYANEFANQPVARAVRLVLDVLNGLPSIVIGIFVFGLMVAGHHQSAFAGAIALAIIMIPLVARATQEVLALVPSHLRQASLALGVSKWHTIVRVVLPTTLSGILTGSILAIARAAGETAPLLFVCSIAPNAISLDVTQAVATIPVTIFTYAEAPDPTLNDQAWAAAFLLISFVLVTSLTARWFLHRSKRRIEGR
jgi:phosphate transport system permease protein